MSYKIWSVGSGREPQYPDEEFRLFLTVYHRGIGGLSHTIILAAHNQQRSVGGSPVHIKSLQFKKLRIRGVGIANRPVKTSFFYMAGDAYSIKNTITQREADYRFRGLAA